MTDQLKAWSEAAFTAQMFIEDAEQECTCTPGDDRAPICTSCDARSALAPDDDIPYDRVTSQMFYEYQEDNRDKSI